MGPLVSIIIPTYSNAQGLKACIESIRKHTTVPYQLIVVPNGAPPETREFLATLGDVHVVGFDQPCGYTHACNEGAKRASGEYLVFLNDDVQLLGPAWLPMLIDPMQADERIGLTGPQAEYDPNSGRRFLIFFCVAIRRATWEQLHGMDEIFNPGFGEDTDFCIRAELSGWGWKVVPSEEGHFLADHPNNSTLPAWKQTKMWVSDFPCYHDGEQTFSKLADVNDILDRNRLVLRLRWDHRIDVRRAAAVGGWMSTQELRWLALQAAQHKVIVEVGSWHGRSSRAIADAMPPDAVLYCIDTFNGSSGEPGFHDTAKLREGDDAALHFAAAMKDHIASGRVRILRLASANAAGVLRDMGVVPDMIFIDGDHSRPGIDSDLEHYTPLLAEGGLICGHDYFQQHMAWMQVYESVNAHFAVVRPVPDTSIWVGYHAERRRVVIDCFPFFNELDLLELRFAELEHVVDRFVITEGTMTYQGQPKELLFEKHLDRFARWLNKITYIVVNDFPETSDPWVRERWQRDALMRGLGDCWPNDIIIIGDADEIPSADAVAAYGHTQGLCRLQQRLFYGYANVEDPRGWDWQKIAPYRLVRERTPCGVRYPPAGDLPLLRDGGWHFSFMGGPARWIEKLEATAHAEYNRSEFKNPEVMAARVAAGEDMLGRADCHYRVVDVDETYPKYLLEHRDHYEKAGFFMHRESAGYVAGLRKRYPEMFKGKKVLEVGSLNINGSIRQYFTDCDYLGIDLGEGPGVDRVIAGHELVAPETYDVVISSEALEHDRHWRETVAQMYTNLKPGGLLAITCAGPNRREHGTTRSDVESSPFTTDYYENLDPDKLAAAIPMMVELVVARDGQDIYLHGIKPGAPARVAPRLTVTACISTKDRYETTLPMALLAVIQQALRPDRVVLYDDGEQKDLWDIQPFSGLCRMMDTLGIKWEFFKTPRAGQVSNHQHALENAQTDLIWRVDDDEMPAPNCLANLYGQILNPEVGAVAGLVLQPGQVGPLPPIVTGKLGDVVAGLNIQWFNWNGPPRDVEHLYSTFLYRVEAGRKAGGYPKELSPVGHREETIFSHKIHRAGYRLVVTPAAVTWHLRAGEGGIRSWHDSAMWRHDDELFQKLLADWGVKPEAPHVIVLDCGLGDHLAFASVLPQIKERHPNLALAVCYPDVFPGERLLSIADAHMMYGKERCDEFNIYKWMTDHQWKRPLREAFLEKYS